MMKSELELAHFKLTELGSFIQQHEYASI